MLRLRLALVCGLGLLLVTPQAAAGGGWWTSIRVDRSLVAPGQRVEVGASVYFRSAAAADAAQQTGRFHVYLLRGFDDSVLERAMRKAEPGDWWSVGDAEAIAVGQLTIRLSDAYSGKATATFTVPELAPATYHLMLCDTGCTQPLPDVIPVEGFTVVADPATARTAQRVDRLARRIGKQAGQLAEARADAYNAVVPARDARSEMEQLQESVSSLAAERRTTPRTTLWADAGWLVAAALAAALALLVLRRGRSRPPQPARVVGWDPNEEELQAWRHRLPPGYIVDR